MQDPSGNTDSDDDQEQTCRIAVTGVESETLDVPRIERAIRMTLSAQGRTGGTLSVALVDNARMSALHEQFMGDPSATDVLTFDLRDAEDAAVEGEIVVCVETARRESAARGHSTGDEVLLYVVHGTLHLLGYDDHTAADARAMHQRENEILTRLGVGPIFGEVR